MFQTCIKVYLWERSSNTRTLSSKCLAQGTLQRTRPRTAQLVRRLRGGAWRRRDQGGSIWPSPFTLLFVSVLLLHSKHIGDKIFICFNLYVFKLINKKLWSVNTIWPSYNIFILSLSCWYFIAAILFKKTIWPQNAKNVTIWNEKKNTIFILG